MTIEKHVPKVILLILLFNSLTFMGCISTLLGQGQQRLSQPAVVGLKLMPGESCHYSANDKDVSFDVIFHVTRQGEASFKRIAVKTPNVNYVHEGGSWTTVGGNIGISMFDLRIEINQVAAKVCAGEKCFIATAKPRNNWMVSRLPFPANAK